MTERFTGVHWMLATPFNDDETIDLASIENLLEEARSSGCEGVVALGVTGEAARMTDQERTAVAKKVIDSANGMPVTLGATAPGTKSTIDYCVQAQEIGAAAVMVSAPSMGKPNLDSLLTHYERIAEAINIPIVVQDYPQTSGVHMPPAFFGRVVDTIPQANYLKLEDPPTPTKITAIKDIIGDKMSIFGGLGGVFLLDELRRGSSGAMTGFAYPEVLVSICNYMYAGDISSAESIFRKHLPAFLFEFQEGIGVAIRKQSLFERGLIKSPRVRHPGPQITSATKTELIELLTSVGLR
ncbi:MAG: dihydrodipicolinate synthase family protein [SAR202 cluster bacterium]|nr:dihydrodipicolinate synthase family protein [SAR202 cluster bacterium]